MFDLKSNFVFKTMSEGFDPEHPQRMKVHTHILFMCLDKKILAELMQLFPQTAENIMKKAMERRRRFMREKLKFSSKMQRKLQERKMKKEEIKAIRENPKTTESDLDELEDLPPTDEDKFTSEEEFNGDDQEKDDMKLYLS